MSSKLLLEPKYGFQNANGYQVDATHLLVSGDYNCKGPYVFLIDTSTRLLQELVTSQLYCCKVQLRKDKYLVLAEKSQFFIICPKQSTNKVMPLHLLGNVPQIENRYSRIVMATISSDLVLLMFGNSMYVINIALRACYRIAAIPCMEFHHCVVDYRNNSKYLTLFTCYYAYQLKIQVPISLIYSQSCQIGQDIFDHQLQTANVQVKSATTIISAHSLILHCRIPKLLQNTDLSAFSDHVVRGIIDYAYTSFVIGLHQDSDASLVNEYLQVAKELDLPEIVGVCEKYLNSQDKEFDDVYSLILSKNFEEAQDKMQQVKNASKRNHLTGLLYFAKDMYWDALSSLLKAIESDSGNLSIINSITILQHLLKDKAHEPENASNSALWLASYNIGVAKSFATLICNPILSDFALVLKGQSIPVHKLFLRTQSDFFDNLVSDDEETSKGAITLDNHIPDLTIDILKRMLAFAYTRVVNLIGLKDREVHTMLCGANFFGWDALKSACEQWLMVHGKSSMKLLEFAHLQHCSELCNKLAHLTLAPNFSHAVIPKAKYLFTGSAAFANAKNDVIEVVKRRR